MSNDKTIESEDFYNLMQAYRLAEIDVPYEVVNAYKAVIAYIDAKLASDAQKVRHPSLNEFKDALENIGFAIVSVDPNDEMKIAGVKRSDLEYLDHAADVWAGMMAYSGLISEEEFQSAIQSSPAQPVATVQEIKTAVSLYCATEEIDRLNNALQWEQNRSGRIGTHGNDCHLWGHQHYECLLPKFNALNEAAMAVVARWDSPLWKDAPHTGEFIERLRRAVSPSPTFAFANPPLDRATLKGAINYGDYPYDMRDSEGNLIATVEPIAQPNEPAKAEGWISVDDIKPARGQECLALTNVGTVSVRVFCTNKFPSFNGKIVTHWMPLPAAPLKDKP